MIIRHTSYGLTMLYNERPPYLKTESKQQVLGLTGALITQAFKAANLPLHWKKAPAKRHLLLIKKNAEPLCAAGWFKNSQREKYAQYTLPIYQDRPTELITRKNNKKITTSISLKQLFNKRKRRYLGRYFAHPMMQNRRAKRDDYKPSAVRVTQRCVP
ncbi:transporter substrate-binding domain-containing protein [Piscirickettsia salmonis]|uniref:transporter substrate-binding domain-containing protein n=2 Tax=Piscirickettsia salmonis TaxID=1238 RepID=UPI0018AC9CB5|nr:hypothetical protein [Piscirickettsia salmonis]